MVLKGRIGTTFHYLGRCTVAIKDDEMTSLPDHEQAEQGCRHTGNRPGMLQKRSWPVEQEPSQAEHAYSEDGNAPDASCVFHESPRRVFEALQGDAQG
jgi:hypothetical protein